MNKTALLLTSALALLAACDPIVGPDFSELDFSGLGGGLAPGPTGPGGGPSNTIVVRGAVRVGPYAVASNEAMVLRFAPADTLSPVDSAMAGPRGYWLSLGTATGSEVCEGFVRARRWDGTLTELVPLFDPVPAECAAGSYAGPRLAFEPYGPLDEPITLRGQVLVEGQPVREGSVATLMLRRDGAADQPVSIPVDGDGIYTHETVDQAVWFAACQELHAEAEILGVTYSTTAEPIDIGECRGGRTLPDLQRSSKITLQGRILRAADDVAWSPEDGAIEVRLTSKLDSARVAIDKLLDDGSYHLWVPAHSPTCQVGEVVTILVDGRPVLREHLEREGGPCEVERDLIVDPDAVVPTIIDSLRVHFEDPVGDHTGPTDVTAMTLTFDPLEGDFSVRLVADAAAPFQDTLRITLKLYNPEAGTFFDHTLVSLAFDDPTTEVTLSGWSDALRAWELEEEVYANDRSGTPSPDGLPYRSSVSYFESGLMAGEDVIAFDDPATPSVVEAAR